MLIGIIEQDVELTGIIESKDYTPSGGGGGGDEIKGIDDYITEPVVFDSHVGTVQETVLSIEQDIGQWTKDFAFSGFENTYDSGKNHLIYTGEANFERIYTPVNIPGNCGGRVELDYKTEGYTPRLSSARAGIFVTSDIPDGKNTSLANLHNVIVKEYLDKDATETAIHYTLVVPNPGLYYIGLDFGDIEDGIPTIMDFNDITCISREITYT